MMFGVKANGGSNPSTTAPTKTAYRVSDGRFFYAQIRRVRAVLVLYLLVISLRGRIYLS